MATIATGGKLFRVVLWTERAGVISVSASLPKGEAEDLAKLDREAQPKYVNVMVEPHD